MATVSIYIQDTNTSEYNRVDLFSDEKISVTSSIQNINDIAKTYTDFSQTFTVPASKQNNKIFKHWYDNSNDIPFSTLVKANAYIEIDTIPFRKGKIQLESANVIDGQAQDYSITFIGILGNLKDTFAGKYLKDLTSTAYDFNYTSDLVIYKIITNTFSGDIMFPLISSDRGWNYGAGGSDDISDTSYPIRYNELFPAIRLRAVLNMIETEFGINFDGTTEEPSTFLSDARFTNAYLYLKNADEFKITTLGKIDFTNKGNLESVSGVTVDLTDNSYTRTIQGLNKITITPQAGYTTIPYTIKSYRNDVYYTSYTANSGGTFVREFNTPSGGTKHSFYIETNQSFQFIFKIEVKPITPNPYSASATMDMQTITSNISITSYMPEIKIEDFFAGLLKMFNLTCYSNDGINYTVEQLESYYNAGSDVDITKYVLQDKKALNRVKTYKRINFEYEKSESFVNVAFNSANNIEYGSLRYVNNPPTEGEEYSIKLPFEDLNFTKIAGSIQVGYCLKTDRQKYIPKPIILYDYDPNASTSTFGFPLNLSNALTGGTTTVSNFYKAFGQEFYDGVNTFGLNFNEQQSTLTDFIVYEGLYRQYYSNYFNNIYNYKARLVKLSAILPTSVLTSLKLNDSIIIRDAKYLINTYTTDLTTGLVQFELLTDERVREVEPITLALKLTFDNITNANTLVGDASIVSDWNTFFDLPTNGNPFTNVSISGNTVNLFGGTNITIPSNSQLFINYLISINDETGSIVKIGYNVFRETGFDNYTLISVYCPNVIELEGTQENGGNGTFMYCENLLDVNLPSCYIIGDYSFYLTGNKSEGTLILDWENIITIPDGEVFEGCNLTRNWYFPNATYIGDYAFDNTSPLTIYLPSCINLGSTVGVNYVLGEMYGETFTLTIPSALMTCNSGSPDGDIVFAQANNTVTIITV